MECGTTMRRLEVLPGDFHVTFNLSPLCTRLRPIRRFNYAAYSISADKTVNKHISMRVSYLITFEK